MSNKIRIEYGNCCHSDDLIIPVSEEFLQEFNLSVGDTLIWEETEIWEEDDQVKGILLRKASNES
jgi:hypothetical protein